MKTDAMPTSLQTAYDAACTLWSDQKDGDRSADRAAAVVAHVASRLRTRPEHIHCGAIPFDVLREAIHDAAIGKSPATRNRYAAAISSVLKQAKIRGDSVVGVEFAKETGARTDHLTKDDTDRLLDSMGREARAATRFLLYSGMRLSEAFGVLEANWLGKAENGFVNVKLADTKNGSPRWIPVPENVWESFLRECRGLKKRAYQAAFKEAVERALPGRKLVPHSLRHTCATWMTEKGVPMNVVADYLGHRSLTTTRRYAHRSTELLRGALQKIL